MMLFVPVKVCAHKGTLTYMYAFMFKCDAGCVLAVVSALSGKPCYGRLIYVWLSVCCLVRHVMCLVELLFSFLSASFRAY